MKLSRLLKTTLAIGLAAMIGAQADDKVIDVAFVYVGPVGDGGWTYAHDQGRLEMVETLKAEGITVNSSIVESVPEGPEAERVIRQLATKGGNDVIFTTSFGFMDPTFKVARTMPKVHFYHATGFKNAANMGTYEARTYEGAYLAGLIAGHKTKSNVLGFVGSVPIPEVIRNINAFTLGAKRVNPEITTKLVWVGDWFNPAKEKQAAEAMIAEGADVLMQNTDSPAVLKAAQEKGVFAFGWDSNMEAYGPKAHLASAVINWGGYYSDAVRNVVNGEFNNTNVWGGVDAGMIDLVAINDELVSPEAKALALQVRDHMASGEDLIVFGGETPLVDQDGNQKTAAGEWLTDEQLLSMSWLVEGVEGSLPK